MTLTVGPSLSQRTVDVEIVVPVYNEQEALAASVHRLHRYLTEKFPLSWRITVADNASSDNTWGIACELANELDHVSALHLEQKGRGRALREAWLQSSASVVAYMDVDLSTDLDAFLPLVAPLLTGHSDVAIGSRLAPGARVVRGPKRELISRMYNLVLRAALRNHFSDAQCGFKALRAEAARELVPLVQDNGWFFDTELLVVAERSGLRIHEVAVDWVDDPGSTVNIARTARDDLKGIARMLFEPPGAKAARSLSGHRALSGHRGSTARPQPSPAGKLVHFAGVGLVSTISFALLFALLYGPLGPVGADLIALGLCALGNLAANRRVTFSGGGRDGRRHYYSVGLFVALLPIASTLLALAGTSAAGISSLVANVSVLTAVNLCSTIARFRLLSGSVAGPL
jgi:putative flippase GtrA